MRALACTPRITAIASLACLRRRSIWRRLSSVSTTAAAMPESMLRSMRRSASWRSKAARAAATSLTAASPAREAANFESTISQPRAPGIAERAVTKSVE